jgi:cytosine/adenosine deaminase-related metal-dependent hydrolase
MDANQAKAFRALVWCPASNSFLFNAAAPIDELKAATTILFGTDSTLTSDWDLWQQLRAARDTLLLTDQELFDSLTKLPATIWKKSSIGSLSAGKNADLCIARSNGKSRFDAFFSVRPEDLLLVMHRGEIRMFDAGISNKLSADNVSLERFSEICLNGRTKYVFGNLAQLVTQISHYYPNASFPFKCAD